MTDFLGIVIGGRAPRSFPNVFFFLFGFSDSLTEIHRVWITIDQKLYIWDYQTSASVITKETEQLIITVALCPPRRGVFKKEVKVGQPFVFFLVFFLFPFLSFLDTY